MNFVISDIEKGINDIKVHLVVIQCISDMLKA